MDPKPIRLVCGPKRDELIQSDEGAATNEQNVGGVDANVFLFGMLATTFRRYVADGPFNQFQESLLHAFARHIPGDRSALGLAADFVDLIDIDDARSLPVSHRSRRIAAV